MRWCSTPRPTSAEPGTGTAIPAARFDSESYTYGYSFSKELLDEWHWKERFSGQPENLRYLNYVADKFDLRKHMQFNCKVEAAHFDEADDLWRLKISDGRELTCRFVVLAIGLLSAPTLPRLPGMDSFKGRSFHTYYWPHEPVEMTGKKVAVIGTGATAHSGHRRDRRQGRRTHGVPAPAELERAAQQQPDLGCRRWPTSARATTRSLRPAPARPAASSTSPIAAASTR